jgi:Gpi18-like mannosyltransferase
MVVMSTFSFAYNFTNPYLTDLPGMAFMILFLLFLVQRRFWPALICLVVSLGFRETAIVLSPLFLLVFNFKRSVLAGILALAAYVVPKIILTGHL